MKNPIEVRFRCSVCGKHVAVFVEADDLHRWDLRDVNHVSIQECFPYLTPGERELFLTEICDECFHKLFTEDE